MVTLSAALWRLSRGESRAAARCGWWPGRRRCRTAGWGGAGALRRDALSLGLVRRRPGPLRWTRAAFTRRLRAFRPNLQLAFELSNALGQTADFVASRQVEALQHRIETLARLLLERQKESLCPRFDVPRGTLRPLLEIAAQALRLFEQPLQRAALVAGDQFNGLLLGPAKQRIRLLLQLCHAVLQARDDFGGVRIEWIGSFLCHD